MQPIKSCWNIQPVHKLSLSFLFDLYWHFHYRADFLPILLISDDQLYIVTTEVRSVDTRCGKQPSRGQKSNSRDCLSKREERFSLSFQQQWSWDSEWNIAKAYSFQNGFVKLPRSCWELWGSGSVKTLNDSRDQSQTTALKYVVQGGVMKSYLKCFIPLIFTKFHTATASFFKFLYSYV